MTEGVNASGRPEMAPQPAEGLEEICAALRLAIADKRAFAICVEGRNGATMTLHNCDDGTIAARMLERFARQQRSGAKA